MSTRKIRNSWWVDFRSEGIRHRKRSPENTQTGAKAYELLLRQRVTRGEPIDGQSEDRSPPDPTFRGFSEKWYKTYVLTNNKHSAQSSRHYTLVAHLVPFFGEMTLTEITSLKVEQFKGEKLKAGLAAQTINGHLTVLGKCLRCAEEWRELEHVPKIKLLKVPPQKFDFFTREESDTLLSAVKDPMWYALVLLALRTGLRVSELLGLEWPDIDLERQMLNLRRSIVQGIVGSPKNNRERHVPLTPLLCEALERIQKPSGPIFYKRNGKPLSYLQARYALAKFCERARLRAIGWHKLRHTFASQLVASGISLKATQELLGHSDIRMTMRYAHLAPSALREAVQVLDQPMREKVGQPVVNA
ncbi:MAG: tyrosine-type recombinase/integrase [Dehalococcoidales bacterium]|nr:tyrosine-type recombinase/integrase [Dehalococcoidales bacterium]